ncbi:MAG: sugar kinase [Armatimonadetes bacterium]|nr:sugar kinase [Armatimonadota bacterium]
MDPAKDIDVLCAGLLVADVMAKPIDKIPAWGRLGTFDLIEHHVGGCAANTAADLAILGAKSAVCGCVGADPAGDFVRSRLSDLGVEVSGVVDKPASSTSYTFVMLSSAGRRRYLHHIGANARFTDTDVSDELLRRSKILHIGGAFLMPGMDGAPTANLLKRAKSLGLTTCMDTAFNPKAEVSALLQPCLPYLDIFLPSLEEAEAISGLREPAEILELWDVHEMKVTGIKAGTRGCFLRTNGETQHFPILQVEVADTSGAGDAFIAGFLYGWLKGWEIPRIARFANATAAFCVQAIGCSAGLRPAEEIVRFMENT